MTNNYKMKSMEEEHKKLNIKYNLTISKNEIGDITKNKTENKIIEDLKKRFRYILYSSFFKKMCKI